MSAASTAIKFENIPFLQGLPLSQLIELKRVTKEKKLSKGEMLNLAGNLCESIFIVQSGRIKIFRTSSLGREQILEILETGDTCACNPGCSKWECLSSAQAVSPTTVWLIPREHYVQLVKNHSQISQTLNQLFAERLRKFSNLIEEVSLNDSKKRLIKFILDMNDNSVSKKINGQPTYIAFTHEEIAQRIGTTRETITRQLNQLKLAKLIDTAPGKITIRNKPGLQKALS